MQNLRAPDRQKNVGNSCFCKPRICGNFLHVQFYVVTKHCLRSCYRHKNHLVRVRIKIVRRALTHLENVPTSCDFALKIVEAPSWTVASRSAAVLTAVTPPPSPPAPNMKVILHVIWTWYGTYCRCVDTICAKHMNANIFLWRLGCILYCSSKKTQLDPKAHFDQLEVGICDFLVSLNAALKPVWLAQPLVLWLNLRL